MSFTLREATIDDCAEILEIRNEKEVRINSFDPNKIEYAAHEKWFKGVLANPSRKILILDNGQIAGVLRFDMDSERAETSIYLAPEYFGRGLGEILLIRGEEWLRNKHPAIKQLTAKIKSDNTRSQSLFAKFGFVEQGEIWVKKI